MSARSNFLVSSNSSINFYDFPLVDTFLLLKSLFFSPEKNARHRRQSFNYQKTAEAAMENKKINRAELELIEQLLAVVNSKEEFDYLIAEKARLFSLQLLLQRRCSKW